jgi:hypothetical protein
MNQNDVLLGRARRAYERARLRKALRTTAFVAPMWGLSFGACGNRTSSVAIALALAILTTVLGWRGGAPGRAAVYGLVAGAVALACPVLACPVCGRAGVAGVVPLAACVVGGLASGAIVAHFASTVQEDRAGFLVAAGAVAALAGSLGCVIVGLGGVAAMVSGLMLVAPLGLRTLSRSGG